MHKFLIVIFLGLSAWSFAQPGVAPVVEIQGKKYYQHTVEEGNTLYGMQRMYGVPFEEIVAANQPFDGLKTGQKILIPMKQEVAPKQDVISEYKVKNGETLYGLSRKFNTTVDRLIELNPELSEGLKKGQVIKVPGEYKEEPEIQEEIQPEVVTPNPFVIDTVETDGQANERVVTFSSTTVEHVVMAHETMYSISKRFMVSIEEIMRVNKLSSASVKAGQVLIIPVKNERVDVVPIGNVGPGNVKDTDGPLVFEEKDEYAIALLLPLFLEYKEGYSESLSSAAAEFYMGAMIAVDSLERRGLRAKLYVYDTRNDSASIASLFNKPEFAKMDMIIGPLMDERMGQVANYCKEHSIRMVCPVSSETKLLEDNRLVYASVPSNISMMRGMARYLLDHCKNDNIILIKPTDEKSIVLYDAFRRAFKELPINGTRPGIIETNAEGFAAYIKKGSENHLVFPSVNRSASVKFVNALNKNSSRAYKDDIFTYGTREWLNFNEMNETFKNKLNFRFPSPNNLDYYSEAMVNANKIYRGRYKSDMSRVAVQGYDILTYYSHLFFLKNKNPHLLMNDIEMHQISEKDGYENSRIFILEQEDFDFVEVERVNCHE